MLTAANGSYKNSIVIREIDDTYIFIKNHRVVLLKPLDFKAFNTIVETNPLSNIILDGRLSMLLYYSVLTQKDHILIYNVTERKVSTIYSFISDVYKVRLSQLTLNGVVLWSVILYIDRVCLNGCLDIHPTELLRYIISNNCTSNRLSFSYIIDNINNRSNETVNKRVLKEVHEYLLSMVHSFNERTFDVPPLKKSLINATFVRLSMEVLYTNRTTIDI